MSSHHDAPETPRSARHWVEPEDYKPRPVNAWFAAAFLFWAAGIFGGLIGNWPLTITGFATGTIAAVRSR